MVGYAERTHVRRLRGQTALHTFLVDPPTMLVVGTLITFVGLLLGRGATDPETVAKRRKRVDWALGIFFVGFWCAELLSYFDVMSNPYDPAKSGNDFMWNGYVDLLGWTPFHFAAPTYHYWWGWAILPAMAAVQWLFLRLGRRVGYALGKESAS